MEGLDNNYEVEAKDVEYVASPVIEIGAKLFSSIIPGIFISYIQTS